MNWISVKDRLPDEDQEVFVYSSLGIIEKCKMSNSDWFYTNCPMCSDLWDDDETITHWMPLPEKPKDAE